MRVGERRAALAEAFDAIFVSRGKRGDPAARLFVCGRGTAPVDLPPSHAPNPFEHKRFKPSAGLRTIVLKRDSRAWTLAQLGEALEPFLEGRQRWPSFRDFQDAGLGLLYHHVRVHGGPRAIAPLFGLPMTTDDQVRGYTDQRVRTELAEYLAGHSEWPTHAKFKADGRSKLANVIYLFGGVERWANEFGLTTTPNQRPHQCWTDERIRKETAEFTVGRVEWPSHQEFKAAGLSELHNAIAHRALRDQLAGELGLYAPPGKLGHRFRWTDPAIRSILDRFLDGRETWPSDSEFRAAGLRALLLSISRPPSRRDAWARHYGLGPAAIRKRRPPTTEH